jgi:hypothetical protein
MGTSFRCLGATMQGRQNRQSRHCEPTGRANARPMTGSAKQSIATPKVDCFVAYAPLRKRFAFVAGNDDGLASESIAAARVSKNRLSRDFWRHSIFDFCNNVDPRRTIGLSDFFQ